MDHSEDEEAKPPARTEQQQQAAQQQQSHELQLQQQQQPQQPWPYQQQYAAAAASVAAGQQAAPIVAGLPQQQAAAAAAAYPPLDQSTTAAAGNHPYATRQQRLLFQQQQEQLQLQQMIAQNQQRQQLLNAAMQQQQPSYFPAAAPQAPAAGYPPGAIVPQPFLQAPRPARLPAERPLIKLSVSLIDTYKNINTVYYQDRDARRAARSSAHKTGKAGGTNNNGWDDENYDYIITAGELFYGRYKIKERIGKGSFGQVVRAEDIETHREVAIKIIKSKKPFLLQAKTEIELLTHLWEKDPDDQHNIGTCADALCVCWFYCGLCCSATL